MKQDPKRNESSEPTGNGSAFFQNRACEYFPCHKGVPEADFNCLFCYCPLYALGSACGGAFTYLESGVKSCLHCDFPHWRAHYNQVCARFPEVMKLAEAMGRKDDSAAQDNGVL